MRQTKTPVVVVDSVRVDENTRGRCLPPSATRRLHIMATMIARLPVITPAGIQNLTQQFSECASLVVKEDESENTWLPSLALFQFPMSNVQEALFLLTPGRIGARDRWLPLGAWHTAVCSTGRTAIDWSHYLRDITGSANNCWNAWV